MWQSSWINFVAPRNTIEYRSSFPPSSSHLNSGVEISRFYTNLLDESSADKNLTGRKIQKVHSQVATKAIPKTSEAPQKPEEIFRCAQNGDVCGVKNILLQGVDVNCFDAYGWTPLMCASCAGHENIVEFLLGNNVNVCHKDKAGNDARTLALRNGHLKIVNRIDAYLSNSVECKFHPDESDSVEENTQEYQCEICKTIVKTSKSKHECSIPHILNSKKSTKNKPFFQLPDSNVGYQMMVKCGWNENTGLGPSGSGDKYPVKTVLKRDRIGLSTGQKKQARVTHFKPFDKSAVQRQTAKTSTQDKPPSKKERRLLELKSRQFEINFRREFH